MRIGVDLGGTKIEAVALDENGRETFRRRVPTPRGEYEGTVDAIAGLVKEAGEGTVGLGIPGAIDEATGLVKNANSNWLIGRPLGADLEQAIGRPGAHRQRRQLLRALRGGGRCGQGRGSRFRRDPRHRRRGRRGRGKESD
jgi:hypothetical protein